MNEAELLRNANRVKIASVQQLECVGGAALLLKALQDKIVSLTFYDELGPIHVEHMFREGYDVYVLIGSAGAADHCIFINENFSERCYSIASELADMKKYRHLALLGSDAPLAKELGSILHACICMNSPSLGIAACFDPEGKKEGIRMLTSYKASLLKAIEWFKEHRLTAHVLENERVLLINAKDKINHRLVDTLATLILESVYGGLYLGILSRVGDKTKVALKGKGTLEHVAKEIFSPFSAAYEFRENLLLSLIATEQEERFLEHTKRILDRHSMEEEIKL